MSARIERADPLALLRELPGEWAQSCVTSPPRAGDYAETLAVLAELHRVLRADGTLWLLCGAVQPLLRPLCEQGWRPQPPPEWSRPLASGRDTSIRLLLLTKERRYFHDEHTLAACGLPHISPSVGVARQRRRAEGCRSGSAQRLALLGRCVLAGSSPLACGICGAPYRRTQPGESAPGLRRPTCAHNDPGGHCLVLDPFYHPSGGVAELAHRHGRSFLGITDSVGIVERR